MNQTKTHGTAFESYLTLDASTNRISDRTYDASGNLLQDGYAYKYDAENRAVDYGAGRVTVIFSLCELEPPASRSEVDHSLDGSARSTLQV